MISALGFALANRAGRGGKRVMRQAEPLTHVEDLKYGSDNAAGSEDGLLDAASGADNSVGDLVSARRVLWLEAAGIGAVSQAMDGALGQAFAAAVDLIAASAGRVVVTGMGKSGHVARKIAATMASVGTPALFVHPGEASHGDMGMIHAEDVVIALSNSGETAELGDIIGYCSRFGIHLIGITSGAESALAEGARVILILPRAAEACPLGLAPTTSTTMMLALGDALAVTLLERRGFSADDFQILHPGGKLGRRLMRVSDIMHTGKDIPLVAPETSMADVLLVMNSHRMGCAGVAIAAGTLVGIITDGDLRRHMDSELISKSASDVMTRNPLTIRPEALAAEALGLMNARQVTGLFALRDMQPVGFIHLHDCLREGVA